MPIATGMSVPPVSLRKRLSRRARRCVSPQALEMPNICNSGLRSASPTAKASSISPPMSVSMIIFSVAFARDAEVSVCAPTEEFKRRQKVNAPPIKRTLAPRLRQLRHRPVRLINRHIGVRVSRKRRISNQQPARADRHAIQKIPPRDRAMHAQFPVSLLLAHAKNPLAPTALFIFAPAITTAYANG